MSHEKELKMQVMWNNVRIHHNTDRKLSMWCTIVYTDKAGLRIEKTYYLPGITLGIDPDKYIHE